MKLYKLADKQDITFINLFPHFTEKDNITLRKELTSDGLHLNENGYDIWEQELKKFIK